MSQSNRRLILASSSPYRRELLERLRLPFECHSPDIDEQRHPDEPPAELVQRLAREKAAAVAEQFPDALIIGSDQVAVLNDGDVLGKPGTDENAVAQLLRASGSNVSFLTGLCLLDSRSGEQQVCCEPFQVFFRELDQATVQRYVEKEQPLNCAGSFKSEGLGITLFERFAGDDPNSLIGLPMIRLVSMLRQAGVMLP